jgi:hypothetical protein
MDVIQASKPGLRIMRYELTNHEWASIKPMLPNKPRGVPRVNDRRVLNGIFWVLRRAHRGVICQEALVLTPLATIVLYAGAGLASGIGSWMRRPPLTMRPCR